MARALVEVDGIIGKVIPFGFWQVVWVSLSSPWTCLIHKFGAYSGQLSYSVLNDFYGATFGADDVKDH